MISLKRVPFHFFVGSVLATLSLFGSSFTAIAQAASQTVVDQAQQGPLGNITASQAQTIAERLLPIPQGYVVTSSNYQSNFTPSSGPVYNIAFSISSSSGPNFNNQITANQIMAEISAKTGEVIFFQHNEPGSYVGSGQTLTAAQEKVRAWYWLTRINPHHASLTLYQPPGAMVLTSSSSGTSTFTFVRKVHGIPVSFQGATIMLDQSGGLQSYQATWNNAILPSISPTISLASAVAAYTRALDLHPIYETLVSPLGIATSQKATLTYALDPNNVPNLYYGMGINFSSPLVDARTGHIMNKYGQDLPLQAVTYSPIHPGGPTEIPRLHSSPLTVNQMLLIAEKAVPAGYTFQQSNESMVGNALPGTAPFYENFSFVQPKTSNQINVSVNPLYGIINNVNWFDTAQQSGQFSSTSGLHKLSSADIERIGKAYVTKLLPDLAGALALSPPSSYLSAPANQVNQNYVLLIHGIPDESDNVSVLIDSITGQVTQYWVNFNDLSAKFPTPSHMITASEAATAMLKQNPLHLMYFLPVLKNGSTEGSPNIQFSNTARLVYTSDNPYDQVLNALTGTWVTPPGLAQQQMEPTDIKGHVGEKAMLELINEGALSVTNGKVHPNSSVTRAQFVTILIRALQTYYGNATQVYFKDVPITSPYYSAVSQAVMQGIVSPGTYFYPNHLLTRNEAADILIRFLGESGIASQSGLFKLPFADASSIPVTYQGDAAIAVYDGILPAIHGKWDGSAHVSVADAAVAIIRALQLHTAAK